MTVTSISSSPYKWMTTYLYAGSPARMQAFEEFLWSKFDINEITRRTLKVLKASHGLS